jgi:Flp pilus assembly CpaF family ATPase
VQSSRQSLPSSLRMKARVPIVLCGRTGAGKTTLLSCCLAELEPSLRVVVAEEVFEADIAPERRPDADTAGAGRSTWR